jgi:hypothetical protein
LSRLVASSLADVALHWDECLATAPSYGLLSSGYFSDPQQLARDSLVVHRDGEPLFLFPLASDGGTWVSHPESFAAGLIPLGAATPDDLWHAVAAVASSRSGRINLRLRPATVDPEFSLRESGAWRMQPSAVTRSTAVFALDLQLAPALSSRRRRAMSKAARNGLVVRPVAHDDDLEAAWGCVEEVYARRGLTGLLPIDRLRVLLALPGGAASVHVAEVGGVVVGAAFGYRLGHAYRLPIYGMRDVPKAAGGTESIITEVGGVARAVGCGYLDLGTSSDPRTGRTVRGIADFKVEMGARPWPVEHLQVDLVEG